MYSIVIKTMSPSRSKSNTFTTLGWAMRCVLRDSRCNATNDSGWALNSSLNTLIATYGSRSRASTFSRSVAL